MELKELAASTVGKIQVLTTGAKWPKPEKKDPLLMHAELEAKCDEYERRLRVVEQQERQYYQLAVQFGDCECKAEDLERRLDVMERTGQFGKGTGEEVAERLTGIEATRQELEAMTQELSRRLENVESNATPRSPLA